ncbi:hypothetical protein glysoja_030460 [Glycine soja]|uniref:Uncharacterized protein n=1 Tax=Glycine soja TaxID=3848 RepID=A0A0B2QZK2_GLYSO|nr:hypothetical protein JHK87_039900 [Glycine soja]KHN25213.1 hypothetical protein glysoja_030460 [Glycine soja]
MAKVAKPIFVPSSSHQLGSGPLKTGSMAIKKTPPELRKKWSVKWMKRRERGIGEKKLFCLLSVLYIGHTS